MNAITEIRVDESAAEAAYRHSISIHCPNCTDVEMAARVDLATMRDQASTAIPRVSDAAAAVLNVVVRTATPAVFAQLPASHLLRVRATLAFTMEAARALERMDRGLAA